MALRLVTVSPWYHGVGRKATCCTRKILDGQTILEVATTPRYAGDDRYRYLHTDCVETRLADAPRSTREVEGPPPRVERTGRRGGAAPRRRLTAGHHR